LAAWILNNRIVDHIFGPNLHVEVIKQSHILLNFLAVEGKITNDHINVIWQAAQLKHCSKQVKSFRILEVFDATTLNIMAKLPLPA
jgi:ubiquitin carboxyl-terminal hydrolase 34